MAEKKSGNPLIYKIGLVFFVLLGLILVIGRSRLDLNSRDQRLPVRVALKNGKTVLSYTRGISGKSIKTIKRAFDKKPVKAEAITILGKLFTEKPDRYSWKIVYSRPVALWIDGQPVIRSADPTSSGEKFLSEGYHDFRLQIPLAIGRKVRFGFYWKHSDFVEWEAVRQDIFMAPHARAGSAEETSRFQQERRQSNIIQVILTFMFFSLFLYLGLVFTRRHIYRVLLPKLSESLVIDDKTFGTVSCERIESIDFTMGFAALLMIIGHCSGANVMLPFAAFGADLFFFCSGMNIYLFLERAKNRRGITLYHLFFTALLFLGGYTLIVIAHPGEKRLIPEFLQLIALGMLLVFLLIKISKNSRLIGTLFFIPFLLHFSYKFNWLPFLHSNAFWRTFLFRETGFSLFPWVGFLFYGIFILNHRKNHRLIVALLSVTAVASILLIVAVKIPVTRNEMSLSYAVLSLFVLTILFFIFDKTIRGGPAILWNSVTLVGRNALMFVFLHYLILEYLVPRIPNISAVAELLFQGLIAFLFCIFFIFLYEKFKFDDSLFFPMLIFLIFLLTSRYSGLFALHIDFNLIDMLIGIVFAFLYIELQQKCRIWIKPEAR